MFLSFGPSNDAALAGGRKDAADQIAGNRQKILTTITTERNLIRICYNTLMRLGVFPNAELPNESVVAFYNMIRHELLRVSNDPDLFQKHTNQIFNERVTSWIKHPDNSAMVPVSKGESVRKIATAIQNNIFGSSYIRSFQEIIQMNDLNRLVEQCRRPN